MKWLLFSMFSTCFIVSLSFQSSIKVESSKLPLEHRLNKLTLPDALSIPADVIQRLGVDLFFSSWFVFLNDDVEVTKKPFTILAPRNFSSTKPEALLNQEKLAEEIIINHIIIGEAIQPESLLSSISRISLGGKSLSFKLDNNGEFWVNDVRILGWSSVPNGIIFSLEDYLFTPGQLSPIQREEASSYPREYQEDVRVDYHDNEDNKKGEKCKVVKNRNPFFKNIIVCTEEIPSNVTSNSIKPTLRKSVKNEKDEIHLFDRISFLPELDNRTNEFAEYFIESEISSILQNGTFYTIVIPTDAAFRKWYPIDWGFNPFDVREFVREVITNCFIEGKIGTTGNYQTLGNEIFTIRDGVAVDGGKLISAPNLSSHRTEVYLIDNVPFIDHDRVKTMLEEYGFLETGPLIKGPYYQSQFLSHAFEKLDKLEPFSYFANYMNETKKFGDFAQGYYASGYMNDGYTLFVPRDDAFWRLFIQDAGAPDPLLIDSEFRLNVLKGHLTVGRYFIDGLEDGQNITMVNNRTIYIHRNETDLEIFDGKQRIKILNDVETWIYNLGNIFFVDRVLFTETSDIISVLERYEKEELLREENELNSVVEKEESEEEKDKDSEEEIIEDFSANDDTPVKDSRKVSSDISPMTIMYINNRRMAILKEHDFDSLFGKT